MNDQPAKASQVSPGKRTGLWLAVASTALLGWYTAPLWDWEHHVLPVTIETEAVLASNSEAGLLEGCRAAVFRISEATASRLQEDGLAWLRHGPRPRSERQSNRYGDWAETPGSIDVAHNGEGAGRTVYGLYATGGCDGGARQDFRSIEITKALSRPGAYYTTTANREGIIVIAPEQRLAAYYYVG